MNFIMKIFFLFSSFSLSSTMKSASFFSSPSSFSSSSSSFVVSEFAVSEMKFFFDEKKTFENLKDLIKSVNTFADSEGYAVVTARFKLSKKDVKRKIHLKCDRGKKSLNPQNKKRQHTNTRLTQCSFIIIAKLDPVFLQ